MNDRQRTAIRNPCYRAMDTIHRRYHRFEPPWSSILSVNK